MFENPRRSRQARNFTTNVPKILDLKSSSEQIFFRKLSLGAPDPMLPGILRSEDEDGRENVAEKVVNSSFFNLHRDYSIKSLTLSNVGEPS